MKNCMNEKINADIKYERKDVSAAWLGAIGAAIIAAAIILHFLVWGLYGSFKQSAPISETRSRERFNAPPEPPLEANPVADYQKFRAAEHERLSSYGWVDRQRGIVHIPVEQAMKMLAENGLPAAKQTANVAVPPTNQPPTSNANQAQSTRQTVITNSKNAPTNKRQEQK